MIRSTCPSASSLCLGFTKTYLNFNPKLTNEHAATLLKSIQLRILRKAMQGFY